MEKELFKIASNLQNSIEDTFANEPTGICYLTGYCMSEILNQMGFEAKKITGKLALMYRNNKKYAVYGKLNGFRVGEYHTWCEVYHKDKTYIVDPSLKYNIKALSYFPEKILLSKSIPNILVTTDSKTYNWKYIQDDSLEALSLNFLQATPKEAIEMIISKTIENNI